MKKKKEAQGPSELELSRALDTVLTDFLLSDKMQNLSENHGKEHIVEVRVVAYKEDSPESPCLEKRHFGYKVAAE